MPLMIEQFMTSFFFWMLVVLVLGAISAIFVVANRKHIHGAFGNAPIKRNTGSSVPGSAAPSSPLTQKLGQKVVKYMVEVAKSTNRPLLKDRIVKIRKECERLQAKPLPDENKRIISTVLLWSKRFDVDRHITDLTVYSKSNQIAYDSKKRDFKLKITGD